MLPARIEPGIARRHIDFKHFWSGRGSVHRFDRVHHHLQAPPRVEVTDESGATRGRVCAASEQCVGDESRAGQRHTVTDRLRGDEPYGLTTKGRCESDHAPHTTNEAYIAGREACGHSVSKVLIGLSPGGIERVVIGPILEADLSRRLPECGGQRQEADEANQPAPLPSHATREKGAVSNQ